MVLLSLSLVLLASLLPLRLLQCDNILVNGTSGQVKIADLGLASCQRGMSVVGTPGGRPGKSGGGLSCLGSGLCRLVENCLERMQLSVTFLWCSTFLWC